MESYAIERCPSCSVKLKFRPSRPPRSCPRCKNQIQIRAVGSAGAVPELPRMKTIAPSIATAAPAATFGGYLASHYRASRWHAIVPLLFGVVTAATLSFLKTRIGFQGIVAAVVSFAAIGVACGMLYVTARLMDYGFRSTRNASASKPSWLGRIAHAALIMLVPVVPLAIAEFFGPREGWLVGLVPSLASTAGTRDAGQSDETESGGTSVTPTRQRPAVDPLADPKNPFKVIEE